MTENDGSDPASTGSGGRPSDETLAGLPARVRVHALAKLLGSSSRDVLAVLTRMEVGARSAQSSVDRETVARVVDDYFPPGGSGATPATDVVPPSPAETVLDAPAEIVPDTPADTPVAEPAVEDDAAPRRRRRATSPAQRVAPAAMFLAPETEAAPAAGSGSSPDEEPAGEGESSGSGGSGRSRRRRGSRSSGVVSPDPETGTTATPDAGAGAAGDDTTSGVPSDDSTDSTDSTDSGDSTDSDDSDDDGRRRRRRGRRGRGRGRGPSDDAESGDSSDDESSDEDTGGEESSSDDASDDADDAEGADEDASEDSSSGGSRRRRRRRRRSSDGDGDSSSDGPDDPPNTVTHVREKQAKQDKADKQDKQDKGSDDSGRRRSSDDEVRGVKGSTRLEAKRQRRRDGRDQGRRRPAILSESEFLARRESVERTMIVRQLADRSQIAVLEDGVLVEHFVAGHGQSSSVGNVYLGRVQNVLPSMEAAFVDIGRGRNAVLYAGEVNWDASGLEGRQRKIEQALSSGDSVLVQVTKDPVGHKGARLTTQISLPGRFLVYVPAGGATGISRKLPEAERKRLKDILKRIVPDESGVIIRTAAEGVEEAELAGDVQRLQAQWESIEATGASSSTKAPTLVHEEPDLLVRVVRDMFNEDFSSLVVSGDQAWETISGYVAQVAPDLSERLERHVGPDDVFTAHRVDEQLVKALDRKVWLPSGGTLVIDRTEAMTVVDVNTGKFTGSGGNLEETVTRNNLEAAEEIVRQLRLRDIGGMIVIDFIDMVLESNRDLVLRRMTECLGRDRTRHQVSEVTSLGLVQMTRKRVGQGLLDEFSTPCEHCKGRGVIVHTEPVIESGSGKGRGSHGANGSNGSGSSNGSHGSARHGGPADVAAGIGRGGSGEPAADAGSVATEEKTSSDDDDASAAPSGGGGRRRGRGRRSSRSQGGTPSTPDTSTESPAEETPAASTTPEEVAAVAETPVEAAEEPEVALEASLAQESVGVEPADDAGTPDAGTPDAATPDAATPDAATAGAVSDGVSDARADPEPPPGDAEVEPEVTLEADLAEESVGDAPADNAAPAALAGTEGTSDTASSNGTGAVDPTPEEAPAGATAPRRRRRAASRPAGPPPGGGHANGTGATAPAEAAGVEG